MRAAAVLSTEGERGHLVWTLGNTVTRVCVPRSSQWGGGAGAGIHPTLGPLPPALHPWLSTRPSVSCQAATTTTSPGAT